jgi:hypothetical protein
MGTSAQLHKKIVLFLLFINSIFKIQIQKYALLHESNISQLNLENFNQMVDITSKLLIVDPETT